MVEEDASVDGERGREGVEGGVGRGVAFVNMTVGYWDWWDSGEGWGSGPVGVITLIVNLLVLTFAFGEAAGAADEDEAKDSGDCVELGIEGRGVEILAAGDRVRVGEVGARGVADPERDSTSGG